MHKKIFIGLTIICFASLIIFCKVFFKKNERIIQNVQCPKVITEEKSLFHEKNQKLPALFSPSIKQRHLDHQQSNLPQYYNDTSTSEEALLSGFVNEYNKEYRDEFYACKDFEILSEQLANPNVNAVKDTVVQFENVIDYTLGMDFPENKREEIRAVQRELLYKKSTLDDLSDAGRITEQDYMAQSSWQNEESLRKVAKILTDEDFEALYGIKKSEITGSFLKLLSASYIEEGE
ncbi:MAG: hypothetical protein V1651_01160 [Patescibacteria group bacterium]